MNFKFKLSRRLAVLPSLLLTATAVATGSITMDILDPTDQLAGIIIQPRDITLEPLDTQHFPAPGRGGDRVGVDVMWSATGGPIPSSDGGDRTRH